MGYQALLFCPDEKLARVVTQVFTDLDFHVEPVNEPFAAVKKLMSQRYDAVVVDCENEQNATLLFKSARNSSSNQNSLALALVEGQAGVAKAYRIGANLVLTKPINVEQAKGTLRVARGLLRKNADPSSTTNLSPAAAPAKTAVTPATSQSRTPNSVPAPTPPRNVFQAPEFESAPPVMAAPEKDIAPSATAAPEFATEISSEADAIAEIQHSPAPPESTKPMLASVPVVTKKPVPTQPSMQGAAAAPAPAKEAPAPEKKKLESEFFDIAPSSISAPRSIDSAPSFGSLGESNESEDSGGSKKFLTISAALVIAVGLSYFGWTKFNKSNEATPAAPNQSSAAQVPPPTTPAPTREPIATESSPAISQPAATPVPTPPAKPSANVNTTQATKIIAEIETAAKKPAQAPAAEPIRVKTQTSVTSAKKTQTEDASAPVPNPLSVAAAGDKGLSNLVSSTPATLPKQAIGTLKISQGVSQGLLINRVQPKYPQNALAMRIQGAVQMEATINREGKISNLKVVSGDPILAHAATEAVRQWRYKPYFLDGAPVDIQTQITVNFKLPN